MELLNPPSLIVNWIFIGLITSLALVDAVFRVRYIVKGLVLGLATVLMELSAVDICYTAMLSFFMQDRPQHDNDVAMMLSIIGAVLLVARLILLWQLFRHLTTNPKAQHTSIAARFTVYCLASAGFGCLLWATWEVIAGVYQNV
ncbi:MAG: hypothetical protein JST40_13360 [Armatimonadetes bacterium]|nr:hypothetical protein [Armatimonadota bacterium]